MFIPLHDGKPVKYIDWQWVTGLIIAANVAIFFYITLMAANAEDGIGFAALAFGHVPSVYNDIRTLPIEFQIIPDPAYAVTALTSAFLHGDIWHLGGNMLFIWVFGDNVEDALGHIKYLIFYLACAFAAAWFHAFVYPDSDAPLIGASGAAAGIVGAYLMLHPKMKVWLLFMGRIPLRISAFWALGGWVGFQVYMFIVGSDDQVSWAAHVGGIAAGVALVGLMKRRQVPLFDREIVPPRAIELESGEKIHWGR